LSANVKKVNMGWTHSLDKGDLMEDKAGDGSTTIRWIFEK
jgi:hypothetical protein